MIKKQGVPLKVSTAQKRNTSKKDSDRSRNISDQLRDTWWEEVTKTNGDRPAGRAPQKSRRKGDL